MKFIANIPELQEFFGYLIDELNASSDYELEEHFHHSSSLSDVLRLVAWQSISINIEFTEIFADEVIKRFKV